MDYYQDGYNDQPEENPDVEFLDQFIESDVYKTICKDADRGDADSVELIDEIALHLDSIMWHIERGTEKARVDYDLHSFRNFVADFLN